MAYITAGTQFWNDERTEGYELLRNVEKFDSIQSDTCAALGSAPKPVAGEELPEWFKDRLRSLSEGKSLTPPAAVVG